MADYNVSDKVRPGFLNSSTVHYNCSVTVWQTRKSEVVQRKRKVYSAYSHCNKRCNPKASTAVAGLGRFGSWHRRRMADKFSINRNWVPLQIFEYVGIQAYGVLRRGGFNTRIIRQSCRAWGSPLFRCRRRRKYAERVMDPVGNSQVNVDHHQPHSGYLI